MKPPEADIGRLMGDLRPIPWLAPTYPAGPPPGYSNLASDLALARQVHRAGMRIGVGVGSPNVNLTLFGFQGAALPSIGDLREPGAGLRELQPVEHPVHHRLVTSREPLPAT